jgi:hypothetical protein
MNTLSKLLISIACLLGTLSVEARCRKSQVCDDYGMDCRAMDICDSTLDLPSIELAPLPPLPAIEIKPLPSVTIPPIGTGQCEYKQVNGRWQNVCW